MIFGGNISLVNRWIEKKHGYYYDQLRWIECLPASIGLEISIRTYNESHVATTL